MVNWYGGQKDVIEAGWRYEDMQVKFLFSSCDAHVAQGRAALLRSKS